MKQKTMDMLDDDEESEDEAQSIEFKYEKVRYTIPFLIFKKMPYWKFIDSVS